jgi:hypothetical protein
MNRVPVERKSKVLSANCGGSLGKPVIITDATENWPARLKCTSTSSLRHVDLTGIKKLTNVIRLHQLPRRTHPRRICLVSGQAGTSGMVARRRLHRDGALHRSTCIWYAFRRHPELYNDISSMPYFVSDLVSKLSPTCDSFSSVRLCGTQECLSALRARFLQLMASALQHEQGLGGSLVPDDAKPGGEHLRLDLLGSEGVLEADVRG